MHSKHVHFWCDNNFTYCLLSSNSHALISRDLCFSLHWKLTFEAMHKSLFISSLIKLFRSVVHNAYESGTRRKNTHTTSSLRSNEHRNVPKKSGEKQNGITKMCVDRKYGRKSELIFCCLWQISVRNVNIIYLLFFAVLM